MKKALVMATIVASLAVVGCKDKKPPMMENVITTESAVTTTPEVTTTVTAITSEEAITTTPSGV